MSPQYEYQAFISYSHEDVRWARRLHQDLVARGITVFMDEERLDAGLSWRQPLVQALTASQHLLLLSTQAARISGWVNEETGRFKGVVDPKGDGLTGDRRIFSVLLGATDPPNENLQNITDLVNEDPRGRGPEDLPEAMWRAAVERIANAILGADGAVVIPILLVTTTAESVAHLEFEQDRAAAPRLDHLLEQLDVTREQFIDSYGPTRADWRPFGKTDSIATILARLRDGINEDIASAMDGLGSPPPRVRWDYLAEDFWTVDARAEAETRRLKRGPVVVVVDPLSLYDERVSSRYSNYLTEVFDNEAAFILVLSPFSSQPSEIVLREAVRQLARKVFKHFYEPPAFEGRRYARCGPSVGDADEFRGWLTAALAAHVPYPVARSPYVETGGPVQ